MPVVTGRAEPQEVGGIAQAWIIDRKVYPRVPMLNDGFHAREDSGGIQRVK